MAVVSVRRQFAGRGASRDWNRRVVYNDVYEVVTDSADDTEETVYGAVDPDTGVTVPVFGDSHPTNPNAVVTNVKPDQSDESYEIWYLSITYDTSPDNASSGQPTGTGNFDGTPEAGNTVKDFPENPLNELPKWKLSSTEDKEPIDSWLKMKDNGEYIFVTPPAWVGATLYKRGKYVQNAGRVYVAIQGGTSAGAGGPAGVGNAFGVVVDNTVQWYHVGTLAQVTTDPRYAISSPFTNSGNMPFDPPGMVDTVIPTLIVTKNMPVMDIRYHMNLKNCINVSQWGVVPPRCARVLKFEGEYAEKNGVKYVPSTWEIGLNPDTWDMRILDAGYGSSGLRTVTNPDAPPATIIKRIFRRFKDEDGGDVGSPVPMDGAGGMLAPDADPVYLRGLPRQWKLIDFNLFIPFNIAT